MPAQSPTLSPTLSAMVAALRGSSSGMPASTLPTMSPPTSAPLVKMPPPRRAKMEMSEAPKPSATSASHHVAAGGVEPEAHRQHVVVARHAQKREAGDEHAGHRAGAEGERQALIQPLGRRLSGAHIGPHRDQHACITGDAGKHGSDQEAHARLPVSEQEAEDDQHDHADDGDGGVLGGASTRPRPPGSPRRSPASGRCPAMRASGTQSAPRHRSPPAHPRR